MDNTHRHSYIGLPAQMPETDQGLDLPQKLPYYAKTGYTSRSPT